MGKRKCRPSMPRWWWYDVDGCWACKNENNCASCKMARGDAKIMRKDELRKEKNKVKRMDNIDEY